MKCVATRSQVRLMRTSLYRASKEMHDFAYLTEKVCRDVISQEDRRKAEEMLHRYADSLIRLDRLLTVLEKTQVNI